MSVETLAAALIDMADRRTSGVVQRDVPRIDVGTVMSVESGKPSRIRITSMQLTLEDDDFTVVDGYTFAKGDAVVVVPLASGGFLALGGAFSGVDSGASALNAYLNAAVFG
jgi:hypothetical protein